MNCEGKMFVCLYVCMCVCLYFDTVKKNGGTNIRGKNVELKFNSTMTAAAVLICVWKKKPAAAC